MADYQPRYPLANTSTVKDDLVAIKIMRESVMDCDVSHMLKLLKNVTSTRAQVLAFEGRVTFFFDGWDDDPREVAEIPEIRAYFVALTDKFPYWFHYAEKSGDTVIRVMQLLCTGHYVERKPGLVAWSFDDLEEMKRVVTQLATGMDRWHSRHNITYRDNQRIHQEIAQMIEATLEPGPTAL
jgi:hypothetical protein